MDRFGQRRPEVRVITHYGRDNPIDGVILDVLIRKHKSIKSSLGVTVAVPGVERADRRDPVRGRALPRTGGGWTGGSSTSTSSTTSTRRCRRSTPNGENARDREKASRSRFAQHTLNADEVAAELEQVRAAIGRSEDVGPFLDTVLYAANVPVQGNGGSVTVPSRPRDSSRPAPDHRLRRAVHRALRISRSREARSISGARAR